MDDNINNIRLEQDDGVGNAGCLRWIPDAGRRWRQSPSAPQPGEIDEEETANEPPDVKPDGRYHWPQPERREKKDEVGKDEDGDSRPDAPGRNQPEVPPSD